VTRATSEFDNLSESLNQGVLTSVVDLAVLAGCMIGMLVLVFFPFIYGITLSFTGQTIFNTNQPLTELWVGLQNYRDILTPSSDFGSRFLRYFVNSFLISFSTTILGIIVAVPAAYAFSRFRFPGRRAGLMAFLVSQMFPGVLMMVPLYLILQTLDLLDSALGLIVVYATTSIPFSVWMLKGYFDTIPKELEESAIMDGASQFTVFWRIILPLSLPAVSVTALFSFMTAWNEFVLAFTLMEDPTSFTLPVTISAYVDEHFVQWGKFAAASLIVSAPVVALFFMLQKNLVGGLTAGGVKG
jgi:arabinogalactan oligomer/maltooligosaccharide transport system permease protein